MLRSKKFVAAAGALALLAAGCSGGSEPGSTTGSQTGAPAEGIAASAWAVQSSQSASFEATVERWNAEHPSEQIDLEVMPDNGY